MTKKTRRAKARRALLALSLVLVTMMVTVGGTVAWLTATTSEVKNTFTPTNIAIGLNETTGSEYPMVPGATITKDPTVTVAANSEKLWLFVKVVKENNFDDYMTYEIADGWTELEPGVYYRIVDKSNAVQSYSVIKNNSVAVKNSVNKDMMDALQNGTAQKPTMTFTAYAIQHASFGTPEAAWAEITTPTV